MANVEMNGKNFEIDEDGFLLDYKSFSEEWVEYVRQQEGIEELNDEHTQIVKILQTTMKKMVSLQWFVYFPSLPSSNSNTSMNYSPQDQVKAHVKWPDFLNLQDVYNIMKILLYTIGLLF